MRLAGRDLRPRSRLTGRRPGRRLGLTTLAEGHPAANRSWPPATWSRMGATTTTRRRQPPIARSPLANRSQHPFSLLKARYVGVCRDAARTRSRATARATRTRSASRVTPARSGRAGRPGLPRRVVEVRVTVAGDRPKVLPGAATQTAFTGWLVTADRRCRGTSGRRVRAVPHGRPRWQRVSIDQYS